jgi:hypothetical protein
MDDLVKVTVFKCPICKLPMVHFPNWSTISDFIHPAVISEKVKENGWKTAVRCEGDERAICADCMKQGLGTFTCDLCKKQWPLLMVQQRFGEDGFLCKTCYETVLAKTWCEAVSRLEIDHRYDFE